MKQKNAGLIPESRAIATHWKWSNTSGSEDFDLVWPNVSVY